MKANSLALVIIIVGTFAARALGDHQESRVLTWPALQEEGSLLYGHIQPVGPDRWQALRVSNADSTPTGFPLVVLDGLSPTMNTFAVEGQVKYWNVEGDAHLEMWTILPDGGRFFSRTVAEDGPLQKISGSSDWRAFSLPFNVSGQLPEHVKLEIRVFMPGAGIIDISPLRIVNLSPDLFRQQTYWWTSQTAGWIAGSLGMGIGLLGALLAYLVRKSVSFRFIKGVLRVGLVLSFVCIATGTIAAIRSQPSFVFHPLLWVGILACVLVSVGEVGLRRHYRHLELRKMRALDAQ